MTTELHLPTWLLVLIGIFISFAIIAAIYKIFAYRKINIVAKKADSLVEDLIYKSEYISPTLESISKLANELQISKKENIEKINKKEKNKSINKTNVKQIIKESKSQSKW